MLAKQKGSYLILVLLLCLFENCLGQITTTLSGGPSWSDAVLMKSLKPAESYMVTTNYNTYPRVAATAWTHSGSLITYRSLLKFDVGFISPGTTVQSAVFYLNSDPTYTSGELSNQSLSSSNSFFLSKVTQNWTPSTVTWNTQPTTTPTGRVWTAASSSATGNIQVDITALIQDMVNNPSANFGLQMALENEVNFASRNYASSDHPNTAIRPKLVITYAGVSDPIKERMDYIFGGLNQSDINTGILADYGMDLADHTLYNGVVSNANEVNFTTWTALYASLLSSVINPSSNMKHINTISQQLDSYIQGYKNNPIVDLPTMFVAFQSLRSDAISANLIANNNERLADVPGRTQSPYTTSYAFASAPVFEYDDDGNVNFILRSQFFVNSSPKTLSSFQVDFDNGAGYQAISFDVVKNIIYSSPGAKRLTYKIQFTDGSIYYSYSTFYVQSASFAAAMGARYDGSGSKEFRFPRRLAPDCPEPLWEDPQGGWGATVTIEYGSIGSRPAIGCTPQLIKPLIILEGLDVGQMNGKNHSYKDFYDSGIKGGIKIDTDPNTPGDQWFGDKLETAGYDMVYVDLDEGAGDIIRNAYVVENIIRWVNSKKINNPLTGLREKNVVLGQSMGGLVGRYAVCDLEKRWINNPGSNPNHEVRLLITHDAPHRGANLPLGIQALVNDLYYTKLTKLGLATYGPAGALVGSELNLGTVLKPLRNAYELLHIKEAPRQLLLTQDGITNTFLDNAYRPMVTFSAGYTPTFTMRALANGSECGTGSNYAAGSELMYVNASLYESPALFVTTVDAFSTITKGPEESLGVAFQGALAAIVPFSGKRWKTNITINTTPATGTNQAYAANIKIEKRILALIPVNVTVFNGSRNSIAGAYPWDTAPGGYFDLATIKTKVPGIPTIRLYPILDTKLTFRLANSFTHSPTVSSLDIATTPLTAAAITAPYPNGGNSSYTSRIGNYITQEKDLTERIGSFYNSRHIQFSYRNANWIFNEMQGISQPINNCTYLCSNPTLAISGPTQLCTGSSAFTLSGAPAGSTINWVVSSNMSLASGQGTTTLNVTKTGSGVGIVNAYLSGSCGNGTGA
ncbi:MAG: DNRLRE domain-containing protein, partial [Chryseolinea sp.]